MLIELRHDVFSSVRLRSKTTVNSSISVGLKVSK